MFSHFGNELTTANVSSLPRVVIMIIKLLSRAAVLVSSPVASHASASGEVQAIIKVKYHEKNTYTIQQHPFTFSAMAQIKDPVKWSFSATKKATRFMNSLLPPR